MRTQRVGRILRTEVENRVSGNIEKCPNEGENVRNERRKRKRRVGGNRSGGENPVIQRTKDRKKGYGKIT